MVYVCDCMCLQRPKELDFSGAETTNVYEPPDMVLRLTLKSFALLNA